MPASDAVNVGKRGSISGLTSGPKVTQHCYRSHMEYIVSDHKPVSSIFTLQVRYTACVAKTTLTVRLVVWQLRSLYTTLLYAFLSGQFPYKVDVPLVTLLVADEWNCIADATVKFKLAPSYSRSSWDWIGLYKVKSTA